MQGIDPVDRADVVMRAIAGGIAILCLAIIVFCSTNYSGWHRRWFRPEWRYWRERKWRRRQR